MKFGIQGDGAPEGERGDAPERDCGLSGAEPITSTINAANLGRERRVRFFEQGKGLRDPGGEGGPLRGSGGPKIGPLLARIQQPGEAGGVSPSASTVSGATSNIGVSADRRGNSSPKTGGHIMALRLQGENELKICQRIPTAPADAPDLREQWPKFTVFNTERRGRPIEDMREA